MYYGGSSSEKVESEYMSVQIIAEAGVNHNGNILLAKEMVEKAKWAGADYIKFQTFVPELLVSRFAEKADYQKKNTEENQSQLEMLQKLALGQDEFRELEKFCESLNIGFLSTPFDLDSIHFLNSFSMDFWKLPSGEITNLPYLEEIGNTKKKVVMSTGMCELNEIQDAVNILEAHGTSEIVILHCNTEYPTPYEDVNLSAMLQIKEHFQKKVGYSDHTAGIEVPVAAVSLGAQVIEKHFTLDRGMKGPDQKASLEPEELRTMIQMIRNIEKAIGNGKKSRTISESRNAAVARKSIVAKKRIEAGEFFTVDNLTVKRPGTGISPMRWYHVLGKCAARSYDTDELICEEAE